jgi:hypothetical protein
VSGRTGDATDAPSAFENVGDLLVETTRVLRRGTPAAVAATAVLAVPAALIVVSGLTVAYVLFELQRDVAGTLGVLVLLGSGALGLALVLGAQIAAYGLVARGEAPNASRAIQLSRRAAPRFASITFVVILLVGFGMTAAHSVSHGAAPEGAHAIAFFILLPIAFVFVARLGVGYAVPASVVLVVEGARLRDSVHGAAALRRGRLAPLVVAVLLPIVLAGASIGPSAPGLELLENLGAELDLNAFRIITFAAAIASTFLATALAASAWGLASRASLEKPENS